MLIIFAQDLAVPSQESQEQVLGEHQVTRSGRAWEVKREQGKSSEPRIDQCNLIYPHTEILAPCSNKPNYSSMKYGDSQENHAIEASNITQRQPGIFAGQQ